tara:strand:- start:4281 stop:5426 length:1146 start_codon:yes stop_codon:yes gene_type:complete
MPDTKTLQINPALFKTGKGNRDSGERTLQTRKKKEKPRLGAGPSTLRKALIQKIKDRQSKEKQVEQEIVVNTGTIVENNTDLGGRTMTQLSLGGESEFDKSIQYMQDAIQKRKSEKAKRKQMLREQRMQKRQMANVANMQIGGASFVQPPLPTPRREVRRTLRRMPQNPNIALELPDSFSSEVKTPVNYMARYTLPANPERIAPMQPQPSNVLARVPAPPYGCLKGGQAPTYRDWRRTLKNTYDKPKLVIQDSKPDTNRILQRLREAHRKASETAKRGRRIRRKVKCTTTKLFKLGKRQDRIGVLVKDQKTRRRIAKEHGILRKEPIHNVREYCIHKGLIKIGSTAPNDVIRTLYEQSILTGDVSNSSKDVMLHNFVSTDQ